MNAWKAFLHSLSAILVLLSFIGCASTKYQVPSPAPLAEASPETMGTSGVTHPGARNAARDARLNSERRAKPGAKPASAVSEQAPRRGGLATAFGESIEDKIDYQNFKRGFLAKPFAVGMLHYNDRDGAKGMASYLGTPIPLEGGLITTAKGAVDWGLKSDRSKYLGGYLVDGKVILEGEKDDRYAIVLRNNTKQPLECVVSVDGLDVMDGDPAAYSKRGYIVGPKRTVEIKGFRTSTNRVSAFRFGDVSNSYAALRHDDTRNVGVIGVAVFTHEGDNPWVLPVDEKNRKEADPFPGSPRRFAIPPY